MKTIGLIGGMSWQSTITYYRIINEVVGETLGGFHSAKILLYSVDFDEIERYQIQGEWKKAGEVLAAAAQSLERGGADFVALCTNTMHKVAPQMERAIGIPLLHIARATAEALTGQGICRVGLLGTQYTMTQAFYTGELTAAGIEVVLPNAEDITTVNRVIFDELCRGIISAASKAAYLRIIGKMAEQGAQGVILGCTEIGLLIGQQDVALPVFDTARIHAQRAALYALDT